MITEPPACVTSRAAASLLCMPPVPSELRPGPARASTWSSIWARARSSRDGPSRAGSVAVEAVDHAQDDQEWRLRAGW